MKNILEYKGVNAGENSIKDIDEKAGIITGYFSIFGNKDSDNDVITKGAYKKTLSENYNRVKHLYQHDAFKPLSGVKNGMLKVSEDSTGLYFESTISQTSWGRDAIKLYADGVVDEHSVGFQTVKSVDRDSYREITEIKLWEGSTVTWGANDQARSKSALNAEELTKKMDSVIKSIRNGKYENEEIFDNLEYYFKQLQQLFINLTNKSESSTAPDTSVQPVEAIKSIDNFIKSL